MQKRIKVWIFAAISPLQTVNKQLTYGLYTLNENHTPTSDMGLWDGVEASGNYCADDTYQSIEKLVHEIKTGAEKLGFKNIDFVFNIPNDVISLVFHESKPGQYNIDLLDRERPLNEIERQEFLKQLALLKTG